MTKLYYIFLSSQEGHNDIRPLQRILDCFASMNTQAIDALTPSHVPAFTGHFKVVDKVYQRGIDCSRGI